MQPHNGKMLLVFYKVNSPTLLRPFLISEVYMYLVSHYLSYKIRRDWSPAPPIFVLGCSSFLFSSFFALGLRVLVLFISLYPSKLQDKDTSVSYLGKVVAS